MIANRISRNWKLFICLDIFAINLIASASIYNIYLFTSFPIVVFGGSGGNRTHSSSKAPVLQTGLPTLTVYWPIFGAGEGIRTLTSQAQRIFLLLYVTIAAFLRCSLDHVFTISYDLGSWCMASTHLFFSTIFSSI